MDANAIKSSKLQKEMTCVQGDVGNLVGKSIKCLTHLVPDTPRGTFSSASMYAATPDTPTHSTQVPHGPAKRSVVKDPQNKEKCQYGRRETGVTAIATDRQLGAPAESARPCCAPNMDLKSHANVRISFGDVGRRNEFAIPAHKRCNLNLNLNICHDYSGGGIAIPVAN